MPKSEQKKDRVDLAKAIKKRKRDLENSGRVPRIETIRDAIIRDGAKQFKDDSFCTADDLGGNIDDFVSTGLPVLDVLLSGEVGKGFALGRYSELLGESDVGKTTLGCYLLRSIQEKRGLAVVIDTEKTLTQKRLVDLGVDPSALLVIEDSIIETICDRILYTLKKLRGQPAVIFWDTIASTRSKRDSGRKIGESMRIGAHAQILADAFRQITEPLSQSQCALVMCNQRKQGGIGDMYANARKRDAALGGDAIKFHPTHRLKLSFVKQSKERGDGKEVSKNFVVAAEPLKNKVSPTRLQSYLVMNVTGQVSQFDIPASIIHTMEKWEVIKPGSKVVFSDRENGLGYSRKKFTRLYQSDSGFQNKVHEWLEAQHRKLNAKEMAKLD